MLDQLFSIVFFPFSLDIVLYCCGFSFILACFGIIRRFIIGDYELRV